MTLKTYLQAQKYLESKIPSTPSQKYPGQRGLERMAYFLKLLGNPQNQYPTIHVGGTAGKGSTCYLIASILKEAGYKTGLHLSPHLQVITERMQVNNRLISEKKFLKLLNQIIPAIKKVSQTRYGQPTYFEILLALSFLYFAQEKVDFAVIEVGLGGQYDGTNVLKPKVVVLTNVNLDHTQILGNTIKKITKDKREIIKKNVPVITGINQPSALKLIQEKCQQSRSPFFVLNQDIHYQIQKSNLQGSFFNLQTPHCSYQNLKLKLLGEHQVQNASLAIAAVEQLSPHPNCNSELQFAPTIPSKAIRKALSHASFPGRLEIIQKKPLIVLDGAHNPAKMKTLTSQFPQLFNYQKLHVIFALTKTKDLENTLKPLLKITDHLIITQYQLNNDLGKNRSLETKIISQEAKKLKPKLKITLQKNAAPALKDTIYKAGPHEAILATGSLYLVGELRSLFYPNHLVLKKQSLNH